MTYTALMKLPSELNKLTLLKTARIYNNNPRGKFRFTRNEHVTWLTIRNENPKLLPASYRKLEALQKLDLAENLITRFPNGARRNKKLDELILQRNELTLRKGKMRSHPYHNRFCG